MTVDRPKALNALNAEVIDALGRVLDAVEADREIGALVVTGAGRAFVAGADVAAMRTMTPLEAEAFSALAHRVMGRLETLPIADDRRRERLRARRRLRAGPRL